jgi:gas vesicle protein
MTRNNSDTYNGYTARDVKEQASGVAQTAVATLQSGLSKTQDLLNTGLDVAQGQLKLGKKQSGKSLDKAQKSLNKAQKKMGRVQDRTQDKVQSALPVAQDLIGAGLGAAQVVMGRNVKRANKNLKKAQKNLKNIQGTVGESVQSGLSVAQDVLDKGTKQASKSLKKGTRQASKSLVKVTKNVKDVQGSFQDRLESYQRKRARAKALFRIGLIAGVVGALLFTPWPGAETRRQLGEYWQRLAQQAQNMLERYT